MEQEKNKGKEIVDTWSNLLGLVTGFEVIQAIADDLKRLGDLAVESYEIAQSNPERMRPKNKDSFIAGYISATLDAEKEFGKKRNARLLPILKDRVSDEVK